MSLGMKLLKFTAGTATGTAIGVAVGSLLAPQRGADLQRSTRQLISETKSDGELAQQLTEGEMADRFRNQVSDPSALTSEGASAAR
jgi:gas vesicle protein